MENFCKICGTKTSRHHHARMDCDYEVCSECEFIARSEADRISESEEFGIYEMHQNAIEDQHYVDYFKRFIDRAILPFKTSEQKHALDFGSGPSPVLAEILKRDYGYTVDIYDYFYAPEKIYQGKRYDLITSTEVVEHLWNPLGAFRLFSTLMKEEAVLGVKTQFHPRNLTLFDDWHYIRDQSHVSFFTPKTMEVIAGKTGLRLVWTDEDSYSVFELRTQK